MSRPLPDHEEITSLAAVLDAVAGPGGAGAGFAAIEELTRLRVGARLFTVMLLDAGRAEAARVHTSHPAEYPVSGRKPIVPNAWTRTVLDGHEPFVANTIEAIADVFPDHEMIASLGCGSVLNVPVLLGGTVRGTVNILDRPGHFTPERVEAALALRRPYLGALLAGAAAG